MSRQFVRTGDGGGLIAVAQIAEVYWREKVPYARLADGGTVAINSGDARGLEEPDGPAVPAAPGYSVVLAVVSDDDEGPSLWRHPVVAWQLWTDRYNDASWYGAVPVTPLHGGNCTFEYGKLMSDEGSNVRVGLELPDGRVILGCDSDCEFKSAEAFSDWARGDVLERRRASEAAEHEKCG